MSDFVLLDWDTRQVRLLACSHSGGVLSVRHAESAPLEDEVSAASLIAAFSPLVKRVSGGKHKAVLVLGGRDVQSRILRIPPVPAEELPDMVRLRAGTEFSTADETAIVDYLPLLEPEDEPATLLVARTAENRLELAKQVCGKLQLGLQHISLQGDGIASLAIAGNESLARGTHLVAACRNDGVDLVGLYDGKLASVRAVPLPKDGDLATQTKAVAREIRRTIAALASGLEASQIESLVWLTANEHDQALAESCGNELARKMVAVDLTSLPGLRLNDLESTDTLAPFANLLGTAIMADEAKLGFDFLAPRKAPEPKKPFTMYALAGTLAAIVLLGGGWLIHSSVASIESKADAAQAQLATLRNDIEEMSDEVKQSQQIQQWHNTNVNWLDELDRIAVTLRPEPLDNHEKFDKEGDVILTRINVRQAAGKNGRGGTVELAGGVREFSVIDEMEQRLGGADREVQQKPAIEDPDAKPYVWSFQNDIVVTTPQEGRS
ncbi:type IV pilus biogenesis protein PilM [Aeoliella mucimassa]|uniref:Competence protein A n=1 Tax=Aeoliella mucimassa TaxID=2527972 RepID=A0A518AL30_9BACT|nr:hypothetical protein [Aeoliella mucimassa]QDU55442.1 hypothetical protein Pan181_16310 [Aeoliella mucimassa]